jgi:glyceraldehyde-3-phosphate dehydrogenase/erythrose-4-phosphate dehydrogenase
VNPFRQSPAQIISCASCTTNYITPVVEVMGRCIGIRKATMTTIHAYTSSQSIVASGNRIIAGAGLPRTRVGESETAVTHHTEESR